MSLCLSGLYSNNDAIFCDEVNSEQQNYIRASLFWFQSSDLEENNTRIFSHIASTIKNGLNQIVASTSYTDASVLLLYHISHFHHKRKLISKLPPTVPTTHLVQGCSLICFYVVNLCIKWRMRLVNWRKWRALRENAVTNSTRINRYVLMCE